MRENGSRSRQQACIGATNTLPTAKSSFVTAVQKRLAAKDMTITDLAILAGVGRPYLHRVLAGEQNPTIEWMEKVGRKLGISIKVTIGSQSRK